MIIFQKIYRERFIENIHCDRVDLFTLNWKNFHWYELSLTNVLNKKMVFLDVIGVVKSSQDVMQITTKATNRQVC